MNCTIHLDLATDLNLCDFRGLERGKHLERKYLITHPLNILHGVIDGLMIDLVGQSQKSNSRQLLLPAL